MKIICEECKKEIDDKSKKCPNCGYKNKLNKELYLKVDDINHCPKCGNKLNKNEDYCTKCGSKKKAVNNKGIINLLKTIILRNKLIIICGVLTIIILAFFIIDNYNFKKDIELAEYYYNTDEFIDAEKIVEKHTLLHRNNEFVKKINYIKYLLNDYELVSSLSSDYVNLQFLFSGYKKCLEKKTNNDWEKKQVDEVKDIYYISINTIVELDRSEIEEMCNLKTEELNNKIWALLKDVTKSKACEKTNIIVTSYSNYSYYITITLKNNNGCTWNIKSYSEVRVYFTDGSYEDVYLSTNVNLEAGETYTFSKCYLGSKNEYKKVSRVVFID